MTVNGQENFSENLDRLALLQPNRPLMVTEFWSGWFDHWNERKHQFPTDKFASALSTILSREANVNFYVLHGGTSFGFMNGANQALTTDLPYEPDTTR
jgi:beta-galactosidase